MGPAGTAAGSTTSDGADLASTNPYSLHRAVHARRSEYVRPHQLRIKVGTWNVAACPGTDKDLARWFIDGEGLDPALGSSKPLHNGKAEAEGSQSGLPGDEDPIRPRAST
jgi:hypothetical protein